jgi:hypothetical protein
MMYLVLPKRTTAPVPNAPTIPILEVGGGRPPPDGGFVEKYDTDPIIIIFLLLLLGWG